ncbi:MAG: hypothetical protein AAB492_02015 [Patescibacteria group bacterium]
MITLPASASIGVAKEKKPSSVRSLSEPIGMTRSLSADEAEYLSFLGKPRGEIASLMPDELARDANLVREMTKLLYD